MTRQLKEPTQEQHDWIKLHFGVDMQQVMEGGAAGAGPAAPEAQRKALTEHLLRMAKQIPSITDPEHRAALVKMATGIREAIKAGDLQTAGAGTAALRLALQHGPRADPEGRTSVGTDADATRQEADQAQDAKPGAGAAAVTEPEIKAKIEAYYQQMMSRALSGTGFEEHQTELEEAQGVSDIEALLRGMARAHDGGQPDGSIQVADWRAWARAIYCIICWKRFPDAPRPTPPPPPPISSDY